MLRFTQRRLGIGAYTLFMIEQKNNPKLKGLPVAQRGITTSQLYRQLSAEEKEQLQKRAAARPTPVRAKSKGHAGEKKKTPKKPRELSAYAKFVRENIHKFDKLPHLDRMKAVARLWKQQHHQQHQHHHNDHTNRADN